MGMGFIFEDLRAYQKSLSFAEEILLLTRLPPKGSASIASQLRRAAMSISANLAEGGGRWHLNDRKQFYWIARASGNECVAHLRFALAEGLIKAEDYPRLKSDLDLIGKMITALISQGIRRK
jgi:four helix bundle protein